MASILFVSEGCDQNVTRWYSLAADDCIKRMKLTPRDYLCRLGPVPTFNEDVAALPRGPRAVLIKIDITEAKKLGWEPGFYKTDVTVSEAIATLRQ